MNARKEYKNIQTKNRLLSIEKIIILLLLIFSFSSPQVTAAPNSSIDSDFKSATIYFNEACGMCSEYLEMIKEKLNEHGITDVIVKDYVNVKDYRKELLSLNERNNIPPSLQGHLVTIIDEKYFFEGHVPMNLVEQVLSERYDMKLLIYQDKMGEAPDYKVWGFKGESKTYVTGKDLSEYLNWFELNKDSLKEVNSKSEYHINNLLPLVVTTGLLAGIHPCTIAVLLFFLAFMFTLQTSKIKIFKIGLSYIIGIFVAFSAIGLGIFKAVVFSTPHFAAKIAGVLVLILGLFNIYKFFFKTKTKINFGIPKASKTKIVDLVKRTSVPAAFLLGIFVGTCSFGCTAGIYFSILGLISTQVGKGVFYLTVYNLMFIVPLVILLFVSANKKVVGKIQQWQKSEIKYVKLISGILMVLIGLYLLIPLLTGTI